MLFLKEPIVVGCIQKLKKVLFLLFKLILEILLLSQDSMADILAEEETGELFLNTVELMTLDSQVQNEEILQIMDNFCLAIEEELVQNEIEDSTYEDLDERQLSILSEESIQSGFSIISNLIEEELDEDIVVKLTSYRNTLIICSSLLMDVNEERIVKTERFNLKMKKLRAEDFINTVVQLDSGNPNSSKVLFPERIVSGEDYMTISMIEENANLYSLIASSTDIVSLFLSISLYSESSLREYPVEDLVSNCTISLFVQNGLEYNPNCTFYNSTLNAFSSEGMSVADISLDQKGNGFINCFTNHLTLFGITNNPATEAQVVIQEQQIETLSEVGALSTYKFYESPGNMKYPNIF
jgi:hypothetical protein